MQYIIDISLTSDDLMIIVLENQPATRKKSDVQGFMNDSGPKLSPEHDRLSWTGVRFGQLSLIGANWTLISVFPNSLIFKLASCIWCQNNRNSQVSGGRDQNQVGLSFRYLVNGHNWHKVAIFRNYIFFEYLRRS